MALELINSSLFSDSNLVSYWRMEGNSNDSKASNNGTDTGITYSSGNGKFGQGAGFNGTTSKIVLPTGASMKQTGNFTVHLWFQTSTNAAEQDLFQVESENTNVAGIKIFMTSGSLQFLSGKNTGTTSGTDYKLVTSGATYKDGIYHMGDFVYDGTKIYIYVDGAFNASQPWTNGAAYAATSYARIGCGNQSGTDNNFWTGNFDDVALFSRALSASEISNLYNGTLAKKINYSFFM